MADMIERIFKRIIEIVGEATSANLTDNDYAVVDSGDNGTRKTKLSALATWIHNKWAAFVNALTAKTSFASGDKIPVVNGSTATAMPKDSLLSLTAQNALAGNVAPEFVPNDTNSKAGMPYAYGGKVYVAKENYSGDWDASKFEFVDLPTYFKDCFPEFSFSKTLEFDGYGSDAQTINLSALNGGKKLYVSISDTWDVSAITTGYVFLIREYNSDGTSSIIKGYTAPFTPTENLRNFDFTPKSACRYELTYRANTSTSFSVSFDYEIADEEYVKSLVYRDCLKFVYNSDKITIDNDARTISFSGNLAVVSSAKTVTLVTSGKTASLTASGSSFSGSRMGVLVYDTTNNNLYVRQYDKALSTDVILAGLYFDGAIGSGSTPSSTTKVVSVVTNLPIVLSDNDLTQRVAVLESYNFKEGVSKYDEANGLGNNTFTPYRNIGRLTPGVTYYLYVNQYRHYSATSGYLFAFRKGTTVIDATSVGNAVKPFYTFVAEEGVEYSWGGRCDADDVMHVEFLPFKKVDAVIDECTPAIVDAITACNKLSRDNAFFYATDFHGNLASLDFAARLKRERFTGVPVLSGGDVPAMGPKEGTGSDVIDEYINICKANEVYIAIGQHEIGFALIAEPDGDRGRKKSLCLTQQETFERYIEPLRSVWGMPSLNTCYYYKDFGKVRLFSLYQYNAPELDDPNDSTMFKYQRSLLWYGQAQLDWFITNLMSMSSDKVAVILLHQPTTGITKDGSKFGVYNCSAPNKIADDPITEIIAAYNSRGSLVKTYEPYDTAKYLVSDGFTESVNQDFSSAVGKVVFTIQGDQHLDCTGNYTNTSIKALCLTSSGSPSDGAVSKNTGMLSDYIVNAIGISIASSKAVVSRIGQTHFMGSLRDTDLLEY